jgi:hypothetical protein
MLLGVSSTALLARCRHAVFASACVFLFFHPLWALGADKIWVPSFSSWFTGTNWSPVFGVPGASDIAIVSNGGTANANSTTMSNAVNADRIEVGKNGTGGTVNVGGINRNVTLGSDFDIGQIDSTFATGSINATSNGTVTISNALNVRVGNNGVVDTGNIDVGSTATGPGATATGTGNFSISNATLLDTFEDLDVAQASADATSTANSNGTLTANTVTTVDIGGDFDIGQAGGAGRATAIGNATVSNVSNMIVGLSMVLGRTSGSAGTGNSGRGTVTVTNGNLSVGFASSATPGDLDVGDAIVAGSQRATAFGSLTLDQVTATVKRRINVGELRGGSNNTATTTDGTLSLVNSKITAETLNVATVLDATSGTAKGKISINSSLVDVTGAVSLGSSSELLFMLAGTTRSTGGTASGQYGALNAASALLDGKLTVQLTGGFVPAIGNQFQIISTTTTSGAFDVLSLPSLVSGRSWSVTTNNSGVKLSVIAASLPGDYNADGSVDAADYIVWRKNNGPAASYTTWRRNFGRSNSGSGGIGGGASVPEPSTVLLVGVLLSSTLTNRLFRPD